MAHPTTFTGSIGVIIQSLRYNDLLGKIGIAPVTFKSGAFKDMLSGMREMTPEEKEYVQALVMQTYGIFLGVVAKERHLDEEKLRAGIADGRQRRSKPDRMLASAARTASCRTGSRVPCRP